MKNTLPVIFLLAVLPLTVSAQPRNYGSAPQPADYLAFQDTARVTNVATRYERVLVPKEQCRSEIERVETYNDRSYPRERSATGSIVGGIAGAILGNQIGKGNGRTAATAGGAIVGAIVGDRVDNANEDASPAQNGAPLERQVRRCSVSNQTEERIAGYDVTYSYQGRNYTSYMQSMPGDSIRIRVAITPVY
jgi:uncharacterized protein YcfJ